jgi:hypothetical protein
MSENGAYVDALRAAYDALEAFALDKWGTTNPVLVPEDERHLQQAYYTACPYAPGVMKARLNA